MSVRATSLSALAALAAACGAAPVVGGESRACDAVPGAEFDLRDADAAFAEGRLDQNGWALAEGGQRGRACTEAGGVRRCTLRNDLFVRLEDENAAHYFRVRAGQTYAIHLRDGAPVCEIIEAQ